MADTNVILLGDRGTCVNNFAQGRYPTAKRPGLEPATSKLQVQRPNQYTTKRDDDDDDDGGDGVVMSQLRTTTPS